MRPILKNCIIGMAVLAAVGLGCWCATRSQVPRDWFPPVDHSKKGLSDTELLQAIAAAIKIPTLPKSAHAGRLCTQGGIGEERVWACFELDPSEVRALQESIELHASTMWNKQKGSPTDLMRSEAWPQGLAEPPEGIRAWWSLPARRLTYWCYRDRAGTRTTAWWVCLFDEEAGRFWFYHMSM